MILFADNFKIMFVGKVEPYEFDELMSIDIESRQTQSSVGAQALNKVADALPGLGIVAAVLGVVVTMGKINEPPRSPGSQRRRRLGWNISRNSVLLRVRRPHGHQDGTP